MGGGIEIDIWGKQYQATIFFISLTVLFPRKGASRFKHQCILNIPFCMVTYFISFD
jgi:hypothetical protein